MKRSFALIMIGVLVIGFALWKRNQDSPTTFAKRGSKKSHELDRNSGKSANAPSQASGSNPSGDNSSGTNQSPTANGSGAGTAAQDASKTTAQELQSLRYLLHLLATQVKSKKPVEELVETLRRLRQEPVVVHNRNAETGQMTIVRTKNTLPGTRYLHAQIFSGGKEAPFVQHMSFEFRPGAKAFEEAIESVKVTFPSLKKAQITKGDFIQWEVGEGYVLWIKKMAAEDLQDDPFNAYTKEDVGTIRVAVEMDPHDGADHAH